MTTDGRIALVIVWFGPLPFWLPAFLLSCRHNPTVNWLFFSDSPPPPALPDNVAFIPLEIEEFNRRATAALEFPVRILPSFAYKLCDLKIMHGRVFESELRQFDFWGCCDVDVVWGDIRRFLTPGVLNAHDIITSRIRRVSGHFTLFRNRPEWNDLFRRIPGVIARVGDNNRSALVDEDGLSGILSGYETSRLRRFWTHCIRKLPLPRVYWERVMTTSGKHQRQMLADPSLSMRWRDGRTYGVHGEEMMYLHFHSIRKGMKGIDFGYGDAPREFAVSPAGIFAVGVKDTDENGHLTGR